MAQQLVTVLGEALLLQPDVKAPPVTCNLPFRRAVVMYVVNCQKFRGGLAAAFASPAVYRENFGAQTLSVISGVLSVLLGVTLAVLPRFNDFTVSVRSIPISIEVRILGANFRLPRSPTRLALVETGAKAI